MKILCLHSDFIEWEPKKKAMKDAEEIEKKLYRAEETLVVFSSVEKNDEGKEQSIIGKTVKEITDVYDQVKATSVVVYPYVHLSTTPSNPKTALKVLKGVETLLSATVAANIMAIARRAGAQEDSVGAVEQRPQNVCWIDTGRASHADEARLRRVTQSARTG